MGTNPPGRNDSRRLSVGDQVWYKGQHGTIDHWIMDTYGTVWIGIAGVTAATDDILVRSTAVSLAPPLPSDDAPDDPDEEAMARLGLEGRVADAYEFLRELRAWLRDCQRERSIKRTAQADEMIAAIETLLKGQEMRSVFAKVETLRLAATTIHQLDSIYGAVKDLRFIADAIEDARKRLDGSGFTEWDLIDSWVRPYRREVPPLTPVQMESFVADLRTKIGQKPDETNDEYAVRMGLIVPGWDLLP